MRKPLFLLIGLAVAGIGAVSARSATATDEHADHVIDGATGIAVQQAGIPASGTTAAERVAASPRKNQWVVIKAGADSVAAWVVYPQRTDKAPVVVVLHENTGLNVWTRSVADQLAAEGFVAIAPDLTTMSRTGNLAADPTQDEGRAGIQAISQQPQKIQAYLDAAAAYAMALPEAQPKYGIVGFCWGGQNTFRHAVHAPTLGAAVVYYGVSPPSDQLTAVKAPVLGLYGGNDARVNNSIPPADSTMKKLGKTYEHFIFDGAGHGFLRAQEGANGANATASQQAWPKTVEFFKKHLGS